MRFISNSFATISLLSCFQFRVQYDHIIRELGAEPGLTTITLTQKLSSKFKIKFERFEMTRPLT